MKLKTWLTAWLLSFCISFGGVSSLITGFRLPGISLWVLGLFCLILCALCSWAFLSKKGLAFLFSFMGVLLVCSLFWRGLWLSVQAVAYQLSTAFDGAYGWGVPDIAEEAKSFSCVPAVFFLGTLPAIFLTWAICRRERLLLFLSIALLPLYPCFVVIDTIPDKWCFGLILAAVLILVLTQSPRRLESKAGIRFTAFALIPAVLLSIFLVTALPKEGCWDQFPRLNAWKQRFSREDATSPTLVGMPTGNQKDLSQVGPMSGTNQTVMLVKSATRGFLYLRYQSFDTYNGTQWLATDVPEDSVLWPEEEDLAAMGYTSITTSQAYDALFIPYYAQNSRYLLLQSGKQPNTDGVTRYRVKVGILRDVGYAAAAPELTHYLSLPEATSAAALKILQENNLKTPEDILQYVKNSAAYDLNTPAMPEGTEDFALWFLQNSDTGYCVHFATAAAVLLRAAGYPARYVAGYALLVPSRQNATVTVKENHAHAWVEYADPESGYLWQVLEATPGDFSEDNTQAPTTQPTQPGTEATQPGTEATRPDTEPSQSTAPGEITFPPETNTRPATVPSTQSESGQDPGSASVDLSRLWPWLLRLGILLAGLGALWGQYRLRLRKRLQKQRIGDPNTRALARWQEICRLNRLLKTEPPEDLLTLAEKAKFSQHTLTKEELFGLGQYLQQQRKALLTIPAWKRIFLRLIWAI